MLARHRQSLILQAIRNDGRARITDLTQQLGVSDMTIRRDLEALAKDGLVEKVYGGAVLPSPPEFPEETFTLGPAPEPAVTADAIDEENGRCLDCGNPADPRILAHSVTARCLACLDSTILERITETQRLLQEASPEEGRSAVLDALNVLRTAESGEPLSDQAAYLLWRLITLEATSLGTSEAQQVRRQATAHRVADILTRARRAPANPDG